jgi:nicotinamidase-related amidase
MLIGILQYLKFYFKGARLYLNRENSLLLIVDFQEKLAKAMDSQKIRGVLSLTGILIKGCKLLNMPIIYTQQYTKGLGLTVDVLKRELEGDAIEKVSFSCWEDAKFREALVMYNVKNIIIVGMETHICVLQTALDLLEQHYAVTVAADATISRNYFDYQIALDFLFKNSVNILTVEAILFGLIKTKDDPLFKEISLLIK